jgi:5-methylthioribose kinase
MGDELLTQDAIAAYVASRPALRQWGPVHDVTEIGDGYLNHVYRLQCERGTLILKQSMPYVRIDPSWKLTPTRIVNEANAYRVWRSFAADVAPDLYDFDPTAFVMVVEDFVGHLVWREALNRGHVHSTAATQLGRFVAQVAVHTGQGGARGHPQTDAPVAGTNAEMAKLMEQVIFEFPYTDHPHNSYPPQVADLVESLRQDNRYRVAVTQLQCQWTETREALIHGDLHTGSVMVAENSTHVIDSEFSMYGPVAWDLGELVGNLLIATVRGRLMRSHEQSDLDRLAADVWAAFQAELSSLWDAHRAEQYVGRPLKDWIRAVGSATVGFAGLEMVRRIIGSGKADDVTGLPEDLRVQAARVVLASGRRLVLERESLGVEDCAAVIGSAVEAVTL